MAIFEIQANLIQVLSSMLVLSMLVCLFAQILMCQHAKLLTGVFLSDNIFQSQFTILPFFSFCYGHDFTAMGESVVRHYVYVKPVTKGRLVKSRIWLKAGQGSIPTFWTSPSSNCILWLTTVRWQTEETHWLCDNTPVGSSSNETPSIDKQV